QRYVCGINRHEAAAEVARLSEVGVNAYVRGERRQWPWIAGGALGIGFGVAIGGILGTLTAFTGLATAVFPVIRRLVRRSDSFLNVSRTGRPLVRWGGVSLSLMSIFGLGFALTGSSSFSLLSAVLGSGGLVGLFAHLRWGGGRLRGSRVPRRLSPTSPERPLPLFVQEEADYSPTPLRGRLALPSGMVLCSALFLVVLEVTSVMGIYDHMKLIPAPIATAAPRYEIPSREELTSGVPRPEPEEDLAWVYFTGLGLFSVPLLFSLWLVALGRHRRRRLDQEMVMLEHEVASTRSRFEVLRLPPNTRQPSAHAGPSNDIAGLHGSDGFGLDAVCRATALADYLDSTARERLGLALTPLAKGSPGAHLAREDSMLSRCIMELDDDQDLRLRFLALEGEMEAVAAAAWWEERE
ncbi:MAG: hypothetical protein VX938_10925, partial [Myxococcota bacterium]|nr:hypothetical protein [Myxococcota bacterium]